MFLPERHPHFRVVQYLFFKSQGVNDLQFMLEEYGLEYLYPTKEALASAYAAFRVTLPPKLWDWHVLDDKRVGPPPDPEASAYCDQHDFLIFYEQMMRKTPGAEDVAFLQAWELFTARAIRRLAESLMLSLHPAEDILHLVSFFKLPITPMGVEKFFGSFFVMAGHSEKALLAYVDSVNDFAKRDPTYQNEADGKRYALFNPLDTFGVMASHHMTYAVDKAAVLMDVRSKCYARFLKLNNDRMMTPADLDMMRQTNPMIRDMASAIHENVRVEKVVEISVGDDQDGLLALMMQSAKENRITRQKLLEDGKLSGRVTVVTPTEPESGN